MLAKITVKNSLLVQKSNWSPGKVVSSALLL